MGFKVALIEEKGHGLQGCVKKEVTCHGFSFVGKISQLYSASRTLVSGDQTIVLCSQRVRLESIFTHLVISSHGYHYVWITQDFCSFYPYL